MTEKYVVDLIKAMSGDQCFEEVNDEYFKNVRAMTYNLWSCMEMAILLLAGPSHAEEAKKSFGKPPILVSIRTPRAYPYNFTASGEKYVVLDQHLDRVVHRWTRIIEMSRSKPVDLKPHLNELFAERFYHLGDLIMSSRCSGAWHLEVEGNQARDLPPMNSPVAESSFLERSFAQRMFIVGHEIAHVMIERLPDAVLRELFNKMKNFHEAGLPEQYPADGSFDRTVFHAPDTVEQFSPKDVLSRIYDSNDLRDECLCDALSIAALVNSGLAFGTCLIASIDAIRLRKFIAYCDYYSNVITFVRNGGRAGHPDVDAVVGDAVIGLVASLVVRHIALLWMSNFARSFMANWGIMSMRLKDDIDNCDRAGTVIIESFSTFTPGLSYVERVKSDQWQGDSFDLRIYEAGHSYASALYLLGFGKCPENLEETDQAELSPSSGQPVAPLSRGCGVKPTSGPPRAAGTAAS
jgi:hypothetical protein